ncbi:hypothetical protein [Roseovarius indicus]|uniref:hypothetical protein n=1 Tax=Roseovarius indicus TaxID=540747 RepID=UPI0032ED2E0E
MKVFPLCAALVVAAFPVTAEQVFNENVIVGGGLCAGDFCQAGTSFPEGLLRLSTQSPRIHFNDASAVNQHEWQIRANEDSSSYLSMFSILDLTAATTPFTLFGGAPDNALWVDGHGLVGLGTSLPQQDLHIVASGNYPGIRLERTQAPAHSWDILADQTGFGIRDVTSNNKLPFFIASDAPPWAIWLDSAGYLGLGTDDPAAPLELRREDSFNFFRITAAGATFNESVDFVFTEGPLGTGELRYNIVDTDGPEMRLNADGDMRIEGALTTGGPTCAGGCDTVFDAGFERLSVSDHAALMWENGHLPAVGPTLPGEAFNVTEKMGAMLNELEHAHIYIEELHAELGAQKAEKSEMQAQIATLTARLDALEAAE